MDDYLSKPFNQAQLQDVLQRWLGKTSEVGEIGTEEQRQAA
jgi:YesN/AraC family two-component response regulator